jgi:CIC family chloride channel protein
MVASLGAVGFQLLINWMFAWCFQSQAGSGIWRFASVSFGVVVITSLIVGWLLHSYCPEAAGSGIPQVKLAFWKEFGSGPRRIGLVKFVAGVISIGGGQSLGREGPTVQIGSSLATSLAQAMGVAKQNRRAASAAGAAAGLAAAFNAPLAAVAFVLEEIIGDLNSRSLGTVLLASVVGSFVVHACIGPQPAFQLPQIDDPTWRAYLLMPIAAGLSALAGSLFHRASLSLRGRVRRIEWFPGSLHPLAGGIGTWIIGMAVFASTGRLGIFGLGYDDLSDALAHGMGWKLAALLLAGKLCATVLSYGFGGCGGIFSPNLFFGAMCGCVTAGIASQFLALDQSDQLLLTVGGMSACLGAVVQAPVTGILIIFEMTHQFALVPGLMLAGLVSHFIATRFHAENFYDEVLTQDGHQMEHLVPPRDLRSWHGMPISVIASFKPVVLEELSEATMIKLLRDHPYRHFPVVSNGLLKGICTRREIEAALIEHRLPQMEMALTCRPNDSIREVQKILVESATGSAILTGSDNGVVLAIVTLHDLLRAQIAVGEREGDT